MKHFAARRVTRVAALAASVSAVALLVWPEPAPLAQPARPGTLPAMPTLRLGDKPSLGSRKAPLVLVAFSDYQCPFCRRFQDSAWNLIKEKYVDTGKLLYVFHDLPLDIHSQARGAAIAARCAGRQNAYWGMQQLLFERQRRLGPDVFEALASELKLDAAAFAACAKDPQTGRAVDVAVSEALRLGIQQTPYFLLGRLAGDEVKDARPIVGARPFADFKEAIEQRLR